MKKLVVSMAVGIFSCIALAGCGASKLSNDYITINQYKGLEVAKVDDTDVSDEEVDKEVETRLNAAALTTEVTDRAAKEGDTVNIDFSGSVDGVAFDGGTSQGYDLVLGSNQFIGASGDYKGFEEQIVGHNTGEEFDITVQFPAEYNNADLAGKVSVFHIKINAIKEKQVPELTDEWVSKSSETVKTVKEYKAEIKKNLKEQKEEQARDQLRQEVGDALLEQTEVKSYPDDELNAKKEEISKYYKDQATQMGVSFEDFLKSYMNTDEESFNKQVQEVAESAVKRDLAYKLVADKKKISLSDDEFSKKLDEYVKKTGMESVEVLKQNYTEDNLRMIALMEKVGDYLIKSCVQVEKQ